MLLLMLASALAFQSPPRDVAVAARLAQLVLAVTVHSDEVPQLKAAEAEIR